MHTLRNKLLLYGAAAAAGFGSWGLHRYMMEHCMDEKGLLIAGNLPAVLLLALGGAFGLFLLLMTRTLGGDGCHEDNFPRDAFCGILLLAAGVVLALAVPGLSQQPPYETQNVAELLPKGLQKLLELAIRALPWLAALAMALLGVCRLLDRRPGLLPGGVVCLFYMMMLVNNYRLWSADPQIHDYAYQLLAGVLLMLCAFHRTCCDAGIFQRKKLIITGLLAAVCSIASLSMPFQQNFYLASALWGLGCICAPSVLPPDPEPEPEPEDGTEVSPAADGTEPSPEPEA